MVEPQRVAWLYVTQRVQDVGGLKLISVYRCQQSNRALEAAEIRTYRTWKLLQVGGRIGGRRGLSRTLSQFHAVSSRTLDSGSSTVIKELWKSPDLCNRLWTFCWRLHDSILTGGSWCRVQLYFNIRFHESLSFLSRGCNLFQDLFLLHQGTSLTAADSCKQATFSRRRNI